LPRTAQDIEEGLQRSRIEVSIIETSRDRRAQNDSSSSEDQTIEDFLEQMIMNESEEEISFTIPEERSTTSNRSQSASLRNSTQIPPPPVIPDITPRLVSEESVIRELIPMSQTLRSLSAQLSQLNILQRASRGHGVPATPSSHPSRTGEPSYSWSSEGASYPNARRNHITNDPGNCPDPIQDENLTEKMDCKICLLQKATIVLLPCGHLMMCEWCANRQIPGKPNNPSLPLTGDRECPKCRTKVKLRVSFNPG
jgi:hypothetical protein